MDRPSSIATGWGKADAVASKICQSVRVAAPGVSPQTAPVGFPREDAASCSVVSRSESNRAVTTLFPRPHLHDLQVLHLGSSRLLRIRGRARIRLDFLKISEVAHM